MEIGLFFGSFNPIHMGHMIIANMVKECSEVDQVWFVVSPRNPLKKEAPLLPASERLEMVRASIHDEDAFKVLDIEFDMPVPSYTIDTLNLLQERHAEKKFHLIVGEDNLVSFPQWKKATQILERFQLIVYPRRGYQQSELHTHEKVRSIEAPELEISATLIRKLSREGKSIKYLVPDPALRILTSKALFQS